MRLNYLIVWIAMSSTEIFAQSTVRRSETVICCDGGFTWENVVKRARSHTTGLRSDEIQIVMFMPTDKQTTFSIGGSTGDYPKGRCAQIARNIRLSSDHAFLIASPQGASVYYWDSVKQNHRMEVLFGKDIVGEESEGLRVAWIDQSFDGSPIAWMVAGASHAPQEYPDLARGAMKRLQISRGTVFIRSDPHYWPSHCSPPSLPLQWLSLDSAREDKISRETMECRFSGTDLRVDCHRHRVP